MNCRMFRMALADWVAGRLAGDLPARMEAHRVACEACARAAAEEARLRDSWARLRETASQPDLRARVLAQIAVAEAALPAARPRRHWWPAWALAGAAAAAVFWMLGSQGPAPVGPHPTDMHTAGVDEGRVIQMVTVMQRLPDPDVDAGLDASRSTLIAAHGGLR